MFSFAIVLWEILTGEEPYANMHYGAIIGMVSVIFSVCACTCVCTVHKASLGCAPIPRSEHHCETGVTNNASGHLLKYKFKSIHMDLRECTYTIHIYIRK